MEATAPPSLQDRIAELQRHVQAQPESAPDWAELASLLLTAGRPTQALSAANEALARQPTVPETLNVRAQVHLMLGHWADAETDYRALLKPDTVLPMARLNLAQVVLRQGRVEEASTAIQQVLARNPNLPEAHMALAAVHEEKGALELALASARHAISLKPGIAPWYFQMAAELLQLLQVEECRATYRIGLALQPDNAAARSAYLYTHLYIEEPPATTLAEHKEWNQRHVAELPRAASYANPRDPERVLRVGLLAPTFSAHAGGIMGRALIENFDPQRIEITCYSDVTKPDHVTELYRSRASHWRDVTKLDDERLAAQIQADGIDILMDRTGHAAGCRLGVFARKPAPIQVSWLEYMNTTGLDTIDYWLSDALTTPLTLQPYYTERIWHLDRVFALYSPPPECPPVMSLPAERNGFITFAVFNNALKIQERSIRMMAQVLKALPTARAHFKYGSWERPETVARMRGAFAREGIAPERLSFAGRSSRYGYLEAFSATDIGLDTFPNNGFTTTLESLWMGVPVVSLRGETTVSRVGHSFLSALGRPEWVVANEEDYVATALRLAADLPALAAIRAGLRDQMARSPLRDGPGHARSIEAAFREMWRKWCEDSAAEEVGAMG